MAQFEHDIWLYQGLEGRIFRAGEEIPPKSEGWLDHQTIPDAEEPRRRGRPPKIVADDDA